MEADFPSASEVEGVYRTLATRFERELRSASGALCEEKLRLAGKPVLVRVLGHELAERALAAFTASGWSGEDVAELRIDLLAAPVSAGTGRDRSDAEPFGRLVSSPSGRYLLHDTKSFRALLDRRGGRLIAAISDLDWPAWEQAKPLSSLLAVWYSGQDVSFIHAGAVALDGQAALLLGAGGSGKTTATLVCAQAGFTFLGDDCVALTRRPDGFSAHAVYGTAALEERHLARVAPELAARSALTTSVDGKRVFRVVGRSGVSEVGDPYVSVLLLPRLVGNGRSGLRPARPREALLAVAPSSVLGRAVPASETLGRLAEVAALVPSYWLEMGANVDELPGLVARALAGEEVV